MSEELDILPIGIGAGPHTDGQILVVNSVIGLSKRRPPFAEAFGDVLGEMEAAIDSYAKAVRSSEFPGGVPAFVEDDFGSPC